MRLVIIGFLLLMTETAWGTQTLFEDFPFANKSLRIATHKLAPRLYITVVCDIRYPDSIILQRVGHSFKFAKKYHRQTLDWIKNRYLSDQIRNTKKPIEEEDDEDRLYEKETIPIRPLPDAPTADRFALSFY